MSKPTLIMIRGNSGSGKSSLARALRERLLPGKIAWVEQDHFRRIVLKEKDVPDAVNIGLIQQTVNFTISQGYTVILEGILASSRYRRMLKTLLDAHPLHHVYYLDVSFDETLKRHVSKANAHEFGEKELRAWFIHHDVLSVPGEQILSEELTLEEMVDTILNDLKV